RQPGRRRRDSRTAASSQFEKGAPRDCTGLLPQGGTPLPSLSVRMSKLCGDGSCRFFCCEGIAMNAVAAHPRDRSGNADGGGNFPTLVQDRGGHAAGAHVGLLIVDGVSLLH